MAKKKSPEEKLGALIREIGFEKAEAAFRLLKSYETKPESKPKPRLRNGKPVAVEAKAAS